MRVSMGILELPCASCHLGATNRAAANASHNNGWPSAHHFLPAAGSHPVPTIIMRAVFAYAYGFLCFTAKPSVALACWSLQDACATATHFTRVPLQNSHCWLWPH